MIKVINPLFRKEESSDSAYNCACVCTSSTGTSTTKSGAWLPWNSCQASCYSGNIANNEANHDVARSV